tara:strand:+ start:542 stop:877 length:336 start_codon:yes stop_codon:yes gene_type:complete
MKRKETSKLLNEWKSFLSENDENNEIQQRPGLDSDSLKNSNIASSVNEDFETIAAAINVLYDDAGLVTSELNAILNDLRTKSPEEISRIADRYNQKAFGGNLEEDPHLSEN